ncbi:hypothetical protein QE152_g22476 [Popillia japonica]|uniref:PHD-type domain-containing protein n=1 Tax=Popillia japonica TaxID=7064 RepID=A0AAW1KLN2_POPJA
MCIEESEIEIFSEHLQTSKIINNINNITLQIRGVVMAEEEGDSENPSKQKSSKVCDLCETSVRSGHRCCTCVNGYIHYKCVDALIKSNKLPEKKLWKCKACTPVPLPDSDSDVLTVIFTINVWML